MTKENIYYMDDNAFDRFYKRCLLYTSPSPRDS